MSDVPKSKRFNGEIHLRELVHIGLLVLQNNVQFFLDNPHHTRMKNNLLGVVLAQGAAAHFLWGERGINDFDLYVLFQHQPDHRFTVRRKRVLDCGIPRLGRDPLGTTPNRRVDVYRKAILGETLQDAVNQWLTNPSAPTPRWLSKQPVIQVFPEPGIVLWRPDPMDNT